MHGVHAGCTGCVRGPRGGKGYAATLILSPPPPQGPKVGAVVETNVLCYFGHHCCLVVGFDALGIWHFLEFYSFSPISTFLHNFFAHFQVHSFARSFSPHHGDPKKAGVM